MPIAALASNITETLVELAPKAATFEDLCAVFLVEATATPGEICEALALAYVCRQIVPDAGAWRASHDGDFRENVYARPPVEGPPS